MAARFRPVDVLHLCLCWTVFTATTPFYFYKAIPGHPYKLLVVGGIVALGTMLIWGGKIGMGDPKVVAVLVIQILYSVLAAFLQKFFFLGMDVLYFNLTLQLICVLAMYLYVVRFRCLHTVAISSVYVMAVIGLLGAVGFGLAAVGVLGSSEFQGDTWITHNFMLTFSPTVLRLPGGSFMRVAGYFDEPGTLALYIMFALLTNKLLGCSRRLEWILCIAGLFTFSLAFFATLILYYLFFYARLRHLKRQALVLAFLAAAILYLDRIRSDGGLGSEVYRVTVARLQLDEAGGGRLLAGDNRSEAAREALNAFRSSPVIGHGFSATGNPRSEYFGVIVDANVFDPLAKHGVVGFLVFFGMWFYWTAIVFGRVDRIDKTAALAWMIVLANLLQRPTVFGGAYGYFVFVFLVYATKWRIQTRHHAAELRIAGTREGSSAAELAAG